MAADAVRVRDVADEGAMVALGEALAGALRPGLAVYLRGDLGAGKTTLTRGIARGLGHRGAVKSPTYTLVEPYQHLQPPLYHFDLYRLGDPEELEFMGLRDYFQGDAIVIVEWPCRGGEFLPVPDLEITIEGTGADRSVTFRARSAVGDECLATLEGEGVLA
jgi:tRNA threonylcarbamoyladenosine biosynthesis protein TsaE